MNTPNMNPPSGLVVTVSSEGSASCSRYTYEVIIYLFRVLKPMLAKRMQKTTMMTAEIIPPVIVVY